MQPHLVARASYVVFLESRSGARETLPVKVELATRRVDDVQIHVIFRRPARDRQNERTLQQSPTGFEVRIGAAEALGQHGGGLRLRPATL